MLITYAVLQAEMSSAIEEGIFPGQGTPLDTALGKELMLEILDDALSVYEIEMNASSAWRH